MPDTAKDRLYFDHNATAPLLPAAREAWLQTHDIYWHNPSSPYKPAAKARALLEASRADLAALLGADDPERLLFVSGASEGNNTVIHYYAQQQQVSSPTLITSTIEHASLNEAIALHWQGAVEKLPVNPDGCLEIHALEKRLARHDLPKPTLVSIMAANNETGVLQPWQACAELCRRHAVPFHCDASQWLGRLPLSEFGKCAWLTASAHKCGGPRGIGLLLRPHKNCGGPLIAGGGQERGQRGGTEDLPAIRAMIAAIGECPTDEQRQRLAAARDDFESTICSTITNTIVLGKSAPRLWNTSALILPMREQQTWLSGLERFGILASTGSACAGHSLGTGGSHVPLAMGFDRAQARRMLRFSGNAQTTAADWQRLAEALLGLHQQWQKESDPSTDSDALTRIIDITDY